ncbi:unnamed protein product [Clavelina lepadiformis]|uniref:Uncharacterized protein n=1 Tax=Clavelina lepadiformis TaxID=159417 RepID=A0ABP0EZW6_CLALP
MLEETITESDIIKLVGECMTRTIEAEETTIRSRHRHKRSPGNSNHPPEHQTTRTNVTINDASVQTLANIRERANTGPLGCSRSNNAETQTINFQSAAIGTNVYGLKPSQLMRELLRSIGEENLVPLQLNGLSESCQKILASHFPARLLRAFANSASSPIKFWRSLQHLMKHPLKHITLVTKTRHRQRIQKINPSPTTLISANYIQCNSFMVTTQQSVVIVPTITMQEETITESDVIKLAGECMTRTIEAEETTTRCGHRHDGRPGNSNHPPEHQTTRMNVTIIDASGQNRVQM